MMMLTNTIARRQGSLRRHVVTVGFFSTAAKEVVGSSVPIGRGPIGEDGRHEIWREGQSSDHDNEPR